MSEYKAKEGMIDNRMVKDNHQEGIKRVLQRKSETEKRDGHFGGMSHGHRSDESFKRKGGSLTPRKA